MRSVAKVSLVQDLVLALALRNGLEFKATEGCEESNPCCSAEECTARCPLPPVSLVSFPSDRHFAIASDILMVRVGRHT